MILRNYIFVLAVISTIYCCQTSQAKKVSISVKSCIFQNPLKQYYIADKDLISYVTFDFKNAVFKKEDSKQKYTDIIVDSVRVHNHYFSNIYIPKQIDNLFKTDNYGVVFNNNEGVKPYIDVYAAYMDTIAPFQSKKISLRVYSPRKFVSNKDYNLTVKTVHYGLFYYLLPPVRTTKGIQFEYNDGHRLEIDYQCLLRLIST